MQEPARIHREPGWDEPPPDRCRMPARRAEINVPGSGHVHHRNAQSRFRDRHRSPARTSTPPPRERRVSRSPPLQAPAPRRPDPRSRQPGCACQHLDGGHHPGAVQGQRAGFGRRTSCNTSADGLYEGTIFHRVKPGYVVQGGGYTAAMVEKPTRPPILNEATNGLKNTRGTLAMARTRALRSATSQFYINVANNTPTRPPRLLA